MTLSLNANRRHVERLWNSAKHAKHCQLSSKGRECEQAPGGARMHMRRLKRLGWGTASCQALAAQPQQPAVPACPRHPAAADKAPFHVLLCHHTRSLCVRAGRRTYEHSIPTGQPAWDLCSSGPPPQAAFDCCDSVDRMDGGHTQAHSELGDKLRSKLAQTVTKTGRLTGNTVFHTATDKGDVQLLQVPVVWAWGWQMRSGACDCTSARLTPAGTERWCGPREPQLSL